MTSPTPRAEDEKPKRSNFALPLDIIIAPARAFERIAANPEWLIAYGLIIVLLMCAEALSFPADLHVQNLLALAEHRPAETIGEAMGLVVFDSVASTLFGIMIPTMTISVIATVRDIKNVPALPAILSLVANTTVIAAIGEVLGGLAIRLHDPASFTSLRALDMALPIKLSFLASPSNEAQVYFLRHFGLFDLWMQIVLAFGLVRLVKFDLTFALVLVFTIDFVLAFIF